MTAYSIKKETNLNYEEALARTKKELQEEGFGILTEINVRDTLKKKLDKDFNKYHILGACNPGFAYQALQMEEELGLLLPCNVIVYQKDDGVTVVSAIDPRKALALSGNKELETVADEVGTHLEHVINKV